MRFNRTWLFSMVALMLLALEPLPLQAGGGGNLKIGNDNYRFVLEDLVSIPAKANFPGVLKFMGRLIPSDGTAPYKMALTLQKNGTVYMMTIQRRKGKAYPDSWNATAKTQVHILKLNDRMGGRVEISCEGPLTGVVGQMPVNADWSGQISGVISVKAQ
jgi:hypothetical protein